MDLYRGLCVARKGLIAPVAPLPTIQQSYVLGWFVMLGAGSESGVGSAHSELCLAGG